MEVVFLGTSCMVPTKERNHQSIFVVHKGVGILIDCGEGTQRQLKLAEIKPTKINVVLLSHWHGDHVLGLPGLLQTLNASDYEGHLKIYGPRGTKKHFQKMFEAFSFNLSFKHDIEEISSSKKYDLKEVIIEARELNHGVPCLGYSIKEKDRRKIRLGIIRKHNIPDGPLLGKLQNNETILWKNIKIFPKDATYLVKGKKLAVILDTLPCNAARVLAKDSTLLIAEAVYASSLKEKAQEYKHMTALESAQLAVQSNAKKLVLTHYSQRYKTTELLLEEAKTIFTDTLASFDLMRLKV